MSCLFSKSPVWNPPSIIYKRRLRFLWPHERDDRPRLGVLESVDELDPHDCQRHSSDNLLSPPALRRSQFHVGCHFIVLPRNRKSHPFGKRLDIHMACLCSLLRVWRYRLAFQWASCWYCKLLGILSTILVFLPLKELHSNRVSSYIARIPLAHRYAGTHKGYPRRYCYWLLRMASQ